MYSDAASEVRELKRRPAVTAINCSEEREQRRILRNRQQLPTAKSPPSRREVEAKHLNLSNKRFHDS
jgi:hypothetical protein